MIQHVIGILTVIATVFVMSSCALVTLKEAALFALKRKGISVQTKGHWIKFSNQNMWCRPAKEYSKHAEICQESEPDL